MAEDALLVCQRFTDPLTLLDNALGECCECGWRVQFRPHAPAGRRVCVECWVDLYEDTQVVTTRRMAEDAMAEEGDHDDGG